MALDFDDALSQGLNYGDVTFLDGLDDFSGHIWVNLDDVGADHYLWAKRGSSSGMLFLFDNVGSSTGNTDIFKIFLQSPGPTDEFVESATGSAIAGQWQSVGFSRQRNTLGGLIFYIDGVNVGSDDSQDAPFQDIAEDFVVGARSAGDLGMDGQLAEAAIWSRVLSPAEFTALSKGYSARFFPQGLIFYAPLIRRSFDVIGGLTAIETNSPAAAPHPPIIYPQAP